MKFLILKNCLKSDLLQLVYCPNGKTGTSTWMSVFKVIFVEKYLFYFRRNLNKKQPLFVGYDKLARNFGGTMGKAIS